jgi:hypothetical protein
VTKIVCSDCRHENEPERIYCHNCGARLDRTEIKKEKAASEESVEHTQARMKKMFAPGRGRKKQIALKLLKVFLLALLAAVVLDLFLPPDWPEPVKSDAFAPMINMDLFTALENHSPPQLVYNQEQVNAYLAAAIKRANSPAKEGLLPISRIFVQFEEGVCRINVEERFFGVQFFESASYRVSIDRQKIVAENTGGYIGRMPIHPALMKNLDLLFDKTWATLARERKDVARLAAIQFHPQSVTLVTAR